MRERLVVIVFFLMLALCAAILFVFKQYMKNNIMSGTAPAKPAPERDTYYAGNVLELAGFLGKTVAETRIDEGYLRGDTDSLNVAFEGKLFEKDAYGSFYFSYDHADENAMSTVDDIYIHSKELSYDEAKEKLTNVYGPCYDEFEEPYVEVNGGAVTRCFFKGENFTIKLASASEYDYIDVIFSKQ